MHKVTESYILSLGNWLLDYIEEYYIVFAMAPGADENGHRKKIMIGAEYTGNTMLYFND